MIQKVGKKKPFNNLDQKIKNILYLILGFLPNNFSEINKQIIFSGEFEKIPPLTRDFDQGEGAGWVARRGRNLDQGPTAFLKKIKYRRTFFEASFLFPPQSLTKRNETFPFL